VAVSGYLIVPIAFPPIIFIRIGTFLEINLEPARGMVPLPFQGRLARFLKKANGRKTEQAAGKRPRVLPSPGPSVQL
jgi:hypothetical protein